MGNSPAFQFYVKEWLSSTRSMGPEAKGVYIDLLAWAWDNGPLPLSEDERARLSGVSKQRFRSIWLAVGPRWQQTETGFVNSKQEAQREQLHAFRRRQSDAGKKSAAARVKTNAGSTTVAERLQPDANQSSTLHSADCILPTAKRKKTPKPHGAEPAPFVAFYTRYPKRIGRDKALKAWVALSPDDATIAAIHAALDWQMQQPGWLKNGGEFVPYPASWLNGRRWEDEPFHPVADETDEGWDRMRARVAAKSGAA